MAGPGLKVPWEVTNHSGQNSPRLLVFPWFGTTAESFVEREKLADQPCVSIFGMSKLGDRESFLTFGAERPQVVRAVQVLLLRGPVGSNNIGMHSIQFAGQW